MQLMAKMILVFGLAVGLAGCGNPEMLSEKSIKWQGPASEYLNKNRVKPQGAVTDWKLEVKREEGNYVVRYFLNDVKKGELLCNPGNDHSRSSWNVCGVIGKNAVVAIHWNEDDGYRVGTSSGPQFGSSYGEFVLDGEEAVALIRDLRPYFNAKGVAF